MTAAESKKLTIGERVTILEPGAEGGRVAGVILETGYAGVKIRWDDGVFSMIHHHDMQTLSREKKS